MRLVILGGGGFRVPLVYQAVAEPGEGSVRITEVVLYDTDEARLRAISRVIDGYVSQLPEPNRAPKLRATTTLADAVAGADFVFAAIRVGGAESRIVDERVALTLGLLGQETVGPGGLAYALRTVPVMVRVAEAIKAHAPTAWTINFTNPAGIITQAMQTVLGDRVVGICDTPIGLVNRVARLLEVEPTDIDYDYIGLNHLGWLRAARVGGVDRLPQLLSDPERLSQLEEVGLVGADWVRASRALPNEYLYYYWHTSEVVRRLVSAEHTRGEFLERQQRDFYELVRTSEHPLEDWRAALFEREATYMSEARTGDRDEADIQGGGYQGVALELMSRLAAGGQARMILNVRNGHVVPQLPEAAVLEVGCQVADGRITPRPVAGLTLSQLGLMARLRGSEEAIAEAALTGDADLAWQGFANHPLVDSPELGRRLLAGYRTAHPAIDALFASPGG